MEYNEMSDGETLVPAIVPDWPRDVYIIQADGAGGLIKIGVSDDAMFRLCSLAAASPVRFRLIGLLSCDRGGDLERELHFRFSHHRRHGEWFAAADEILDFADRFGLSRMGDLIDMQDRVDRTFSVQGEKRRSPTVERHHMTRNALIKSIRNGAFERIYLREKAGTSYQPSSTVGRPI